MALRDIWSANLDNATTASVLAWHCAASAYQNIMAVQLATLAKEALPPSKLAVVGASTQKARCKGRASGRGVVSFNG